MSDRGGHIILLKPCKNSPGAFGNRSDLCTEHARLQTAKRNAAKMEPVTNEKVEAAKEAAIGKATDLFKKGKAEIDKVGRARCLQPFPNSFCSVSLLCSIGIQRDSEDVAEDPGLTSSRPYFLSSTVCPFRRQSHREH